MVVKLPVEASENDLEVSIFFGEDKLSSKLLKPLPPCGDTVCEERIVVFSTEALRKKKKN
jgi:hypothetical protein